MTDTKRKPHHEKALHHNISRIYFIIMSIIFLFIFIALCMIPSSLPYLIKHIPDYHDEPTHDLVVGCIVGAPISLILSELFMFFAIHHHRHYIHKSNAEIQEKSRKTATGK